MKSQALNVQSYKDSKELQKAHPEVRSWAYVLHIPRGMSEEAAKAKLIETLTRQGQWYSMVYRVGDFFMAPQVTTLPVLKPEPRAQGCSCLEYIGDNGPCSMHGNPYAHLQGS